MTRPETWELSTWPEGVKRREEEGEVGGGREVGGNEEEGREREEEEEGGEGKEGEGERRR